MEESGDCSSRQGPGVVTAPPARPSPPRYQFSRGPDSEDRLPLGTAAPFSSTMLLLTADTCQPASPSHLSAGTGAASGARVREQRVLWGSTVGAPPRLASILISRREAHDAGKGWNTPPSPDSQFDPGCQPEVSEL